LPTAVLEIPVVLLKSASTPVAVLASPSVLDKAASPTAVLALALLTWRAPVSTAVLSLPTVLRGSVEADVRAREVAASSSTSVTLALFVVGCAIFSFFSG
jgi:hypothetical protein